METIEGNGVKQFCGDSLPGSTENGPDAKTAAYEAVRFNAMKHGILSGWRYWRMKIMPSLTTCWRR
jgi:hypothetical protein